jgi:hypothetical protein
MLFLISMALSILKALLFGYICGCFVKAHIYGNVSKNYMPHNHTRQSFLMFYHLELPLKTWKIALL